MCVKMVTFREKIPIKGKTEMCVLFSVDENVP